MSLSAEDMRLTEVPLLLGRFLPGGWVRHPPLARWHTEVDSLEKNKKKKKEEEEDCPARPRLPPGGEPDLGRELCQPGPALLPAPSLPLLPGQQQQVVVVALSVLQQQVQGQAGRKEARSRSGEREEK